MAKANQKKSIGSTNLYGPKLGNGDAEKFTMEIFKISRQEKLNGRKGIPITAWGPAGIGKTEFGKMIVNKHKDFFDGNIAYVPLAQIEEKAELQGLPETIKIRKKLTPELKKNLDLSRVTIVEEKNPKTGKVESWITSIRTVYGTPSWIPQVETHGERGLLFIDDMNRPDARILNSIMQLLQDAELLGWKLPIGWEIFSTCNPDNGKYDVTPLDGAQMSRSANFEMTFDEKSWLENWAIPTGIHQTAQNYVMTAKEFVVRGERTNPRSFDKFFRIVGPLLDDLQKIKEGKIVANSNSEGASIVRKIQVFGQMNIEEESLQSFIKFLTSGFHKLPSVEQILSSKFEKEIKEFYEKLTVAGMLRVDIIAAINHRIEIYARNNADKIQKNKSMIKGLQVWVKYPKLPPDNRYALIDTLSPHVPDVIDEEICELIYARGMKNRR